MEKPKDYTGAIERFFQPVLPSRDLRRGRSVEVTLAGARFSLARAADGAPSARGDLRVRAIDRGDYVWLGGEALGREAEPTCDESADGFEQVAAFGARFDAPLHVAFDNFSEDEHTPWVHNFLGWREDDTHAVHFESDNFDDRTEVYYRGKQRPHLLTPGILVRPGDDFHNRWVTRFDPIRTTYTLSWNSANTGAPRPVVSRFVIYFVPETDRTTWLHSLVYAKIRPSLRFLFPVVRRVVPLVGKNEVNDDGRFIPHVADTPFSLEGMRLGKYDKPIIHNHRLLERIYAAR